MWKFQEFPTTQILREIKVAQTRVSQSAILTRLGAMNFDFSSIFAFSEGCNLPKSKIQNPYHCKNGVGLTFAFSKNDFT